MSRSWWWRTLLILGLVGYAVYYLVPSWVYFRLPADERNDSSLLEKLTPHWAPKKHLNLGLDLQGGIELVMGVDADKAMRDKAVLRADDLRRLATEKKLPFKDIKAVRGQPQIAIVGGSPAEAKAIADMTQEQYPDNFQVIASAGNQTTLGFQDAWVKKQKDDTVEQAVKSLRNRIDKWGVSEAEIKRIRGSDGIQIQLPGFKDPERAKQLLGQTAQLEFKIADDDDRSLAKVEHDLPPTMHYGLDGQMPYVCAQDRQALEKFVAGKAPDGDEYGIQKIEAISPDVKSMPCEVPYYRTITLHAKTEVTGDQLTDARVQLDSSGGIQKPVVGFTLDKDGAEKFGELTGSNIGKRLAIVLDGMVNSAPVIQSKITDSGQITLGGLKSQQETYQEATDLALVLKAGALPAPVRILEERTVGASLGPELIRKGTWGALAGLFLVWLFMAFYYRMSGFVADVALGVNGLLLLAAMAMFGSTLTLPGIAGTVLTLGMAVDANVLINERIREELRAGKTSRGAVDAGYDKVFWTIVDGHVTAFVAGAILYYTGTGPVKGFAVTLMIGLAASMFTSIVVTRQIIDVLVRRGSPMRRAAA
ncbi:MAG: protein translocase subunit SecD [Deltaproteobacteria bacterium]